MLSNLLDKCNKLGLKMTDQRKVIIEVLSTAVDHPDAPHTHPHTHTHRYVNPCSQPS